MRATRESLRQLQWTDHKISLEEVMNLQQFITKVLEFLKEKLVASKKEWEKRSILIQSLSRRVSSKWIAKVFKL